MDDFDQSLERDAETLSKGEKIPAVDRELFREVSSEAISISDEVVRTIGDLGEDEMYVLSIHLKQQKIINI